MEKVNVSRHAVKDGTVVEFSLRVYANELSELSAYDRYLREQIRNDFGTLFRKFGMDFTTESAYVARDGESAVRLILCLEGDTSQSLLRELDDLGIREGE